MTLARRSVIARVTLYSPWPQWSACGDCSNFENHSTYARCFGRSETGTQGNKVAIPLSGIWKMTRTCATWKSARPRTWELASVSSGEIVATHHGLSGFILRIHQVYSPSGTFESADGTLIQYQLYMVDSSGIVCCKIRMKRTQSPSGSCRHSAHGLTYVAQYTRIHG